MTQFYWYFLHFIKLSIAQTAIIEFAKHPCCFNIPSCRPHHLQAQLEYTILVLLINQRYCSIYPARRRRKVGCKMGNVDVNMIYKQYKLIRKLSMMTRKSSEICANFLWMVPKETNSMYSAAATTSKKLLLKLNGLFKYPVFLSTWWYLIGLVGYPHRL